MNKKHNQILQITLLAIFTAIIILLSFTPLGYIKTGIVEITLVTIPVIVGCIITGWKGGLFLGFVFGVSSFIQCFTGSVFGEMMVSINAFKALIECIVPRILMGGLTGLLADILINRKQREKLHNYIICSVVGSLLNTIFFTSLFCIFFYNEPEVLDIRNTLGSTNVLTFMILFVGINGLIELGVNTLAGTLLSSVYYKIKRR